MTKRENTEISYIIHSFMTQRLKLRVSELRIFAIIYSFTNGKGGFYFGTLGYLAKAAAVSQSTVKRALVKLLEKGYIEKCEINGIQGYKSCVSEREATEDMPDSKSDEAKAAEAEAKFTASPEKDYCEKRESALPAPHVLEDLDIKIESILARDVKRPKFEFYQFGKNGLVSMTAEQYKQLLKLVSQEQLSVYIRRLEMLMENKGYRTFSPYKTIKGWIKDDTDL